MDTEFLAKVSDLPVGSNLAVTASDGREIGLFNVGGKIYAIDNICPHAGAPLAEGIVADCTVTCPWHYWEFNLATGECLTVPDVFVAVIPITIEGDFILLIKQGEGP